MACGSISIERCQRDYSQSFDSLSIGHPDRQSHHTHSVCVCVCAIVNMDHVKALTQLKFMDPRDITLTYDHVLANYIQVDPHPVTPRPSLGMTFTS